MNSIKNFINDESGVTAIEYALIAALLVVVISAAFTSLGSEITRLFAKITSTTGLVK